MQCVLYFEARPRDVNHLYISANDWNDHLVNQNSYLLIKADMMERYGHGENGDVIELHYSMENMIYTDSFQFMDTILSGIDTFPNDQRPLIMSNLIAAEGFIIDLIIDTKKAVEDQMMGKLRSLLTD